MEGYEWATDHYPRMKRWGYVKDGNWGRQAAVGTVFMRTNEEGKYFAGSTNMLELGEFATLEEAQAAVINSLKA